MCAGVDGPSASSYRRPSYNRPVRQTRDYRNKSRDECGGMKKTCSCGQINPTNTNCWKCGKPNHYSKA